MGENVKFGCDANQFYLFKLSTHVFKQTQYKEDRHAGNMYWLHSWHLRSTICAYFKSLDLSYQYSEASPIFGHANANLNDYHYSFL